MYFRPVLNWILRYFEVELSDYMKWELLEIIGHLYFVIGILGRDVFNNFRYQLSDSLKHNLSDNFAIVLSGKLCYELSVF